MGGTQRTRRSGKRAKKKRDQRGLLLNEVRKPAGSAGFVLIDVVVASALLLAVLVTIGLLFGTQLQSVSESSVESQADALLNQAVEQARALPSTTISEGILPSDALNDANADVNGVSHGKNYIDVNGSGSTGYACTTTTNLTPASAEPIPCSSSAPSGAPLVPEASTQTVGSRTFTVYTYPSIDANHSFAAAAFSIEVALNLGVYVAVIPAGSFSSGTSCSSLATGMSVWGTYIVPGTTITSVSCLLGTATVTLSQAATSIVSAGTLWFGWPNSAVYRVSVVVTWKSLQNGWISRIFGQTLVYSPPSSS